MKDLQVLSDQEKLHKLINEETGVLKLKKNLNRLIKTTLRFAYSKIIILSLLKNQKAITIWK